MIQNNTKEVNESVEKLKDELNAFQQNTQTALSTCSKQVEEVAASLGDKIGVEVKGVNERVDKLHLELKSDINTTNSQLNTETEKLQSGIEVFDENRY